MTNTKHTQLSDHGLKYAATLKPHQREVAAAAAAGMDALYRPS